MTHRDITFDIANGVAAITLNRPTRRNAFTAVMGRELGDAYRACDADDAVRAVVLTGAPPAFCAGADMAAGEAMFEHRPEPTFSASPVAPAAWEVRKPVIAAINGHAIGIGLTLALQCDIRIVAEDAKYGVVQVRRGVMPDAMSHWTLPRITNLAVAADVLLTGRMFEGREAKELGLASRCLPAADVLPAAMDIARDIAVNTAPLSVAVTKRLLWESPHRTPEQIERLETLLHQHLMGRPDSREGVLAFVEKREPAWQGRVSREWPDWPAV